MKMNAASIKNQKAEWEALGVKLPAFERTVSSHWVRVRSQALRKPRNGWSGCR